MMFGVVDRGREPRLAHEPLPERVVLGEIGAQDLEGDLVPEAHVVGAEHDAHPATTEHALDPRYEAKSEPTRGMWPMLADAP